MHALVLILALGVLLQQPPRYSPIQDGDAHGDPPYLIEPGWAPLLNGTDLAGWRACEEGAKNECLYEVQIFDSWGTTGELKTSDGGAIYHQWIDGRGLGGSPPLVNASRRPGEWQSYQIWFRAPRFDAAGTKIVPARFVRVLFNGLLVQKEVNVDGPTRAHLSIPEAAENPLMLQGDHGPVVYRNIYIRPLRDIVVR